MYNERDSLIIRHKITQAGLRCRQNQSILNSVNSSFFWLLEISYAHNATLDICESARSAIVTFVGNGHGDTSSNPGQDCLHFM